MTSPRWMIYGANGYTGTLVAREAVRRGQRPVLAGRSADKVAAVARELDLPTAAFDLADGAAVARALEGIEAVVNAAGPFVHTVEPMIRGCLAVGASYLDITGEIPVFQTTFSFDGPAMERGVCLMSGVGFDVVPTDCMARYVAEQLPDATTLDIAPNGAHAAELARLASVARSEGRGLWGACGGPDVPVR